MFSFLIMGLHELSAFNPTRVGLFRVPQGRGGGGGGGESGRPIPLGHGITLPILFTLAFNFCQK